MKVYNAMKPAILALATVGLLSGCAIFDAPPGDIPPWPNYPALAVSYRMVADRDYDGAVSAECKYVSDACAVTNLLARTCVITLKQSAQMDAGLLAHEQRHCKGRRHRT